MNKLYSMHVIDKGTRRWGFRTLCRQPRRRSSASTQRGAPQTDATMATTSFTEPPQRPMTPWGTAYAELYQDRISRSAKMISKHMRTRLRVSRTILVPALRSRRELPESPQARRADRPKSATMSKMDTGAHTSDPRLTVHLGQSHVLKVNR